MQNFTKDGIYEAIQAVACTSSLYGNNFIHTLTAVNILFAITSTIGNALILAALRKESSLHPPSKLMFQCLAVTDLCVGVLAQPVFVIQLMSITQKRVQLCYTVVSINEVAGGSFSGVSLFTLTAISVDRLLALLLGLRYKQTITLRRTRLLLILFWVLNIAICSMRRFWKHVLISNVVSVLIYSSLAISAFSYLKIYLALRRHHNAMQVTMSTNFTKDEIYEIIQALACTPSQYGNHFIHSLAAINIILAITATLGNALILAALRKSSSLHPPSKLMFQCLAVTDLCVGVLAQPVFVIQLISTTYEQPHLCFAVVSINEIAGSSFSGVSLLTLTAISVDRLLALRLGLRYRQTVTLRRTRFVVIFIWIFNISTNSLRRFWHYFLISRVISVVIYSSLAISAFCYLKIYVTLRQHYAVQDIVQQGQSNQGRTNPLNIARYRRTVSTALYVQFALVACYLPYGVVVAIALAGGYLPSFNLAVRLTITLVLLNSSLNPILYCWKINGVRQAVRDMVTHPCSFFSSS
ncbi:hypothetical protein ACROYT_G034012 [Oculina patagonica]